MHFMWERNYFVDLFREMLIRNITFAVLQTEEEDTRLEWV